MKTDFLQSHCVFLLVKRGLRKIALAVVLICLTVSAVSCRTVKEIETHYDTIIKTDTTEIYIHDTTKIVDVRYDSVDRDVERIIYVDSNGVMHEKEKETLTHYIYQQSEAYKVKEAEYKSKISNLEKQLSEKQKVEYVEKKLNWFQKTLMGLGVCFIIVFICFCVYLYFRIKTK